MRFIVVVSLCITSVELLSLMQFSDEVLENAITNNYDVIFAGLNEPLMSPLVKNLKRPKIITSRSMCQVFRRTRVILLLQNLTDSSKVTRFQVFMNPST